MKSVSHKVYVRRDFTPKKDWAVFLDRDGTINVEKHLVHKLKDFELISGAAEAIKRLNKREIPVVVCHNANVVARGMCGEEQVEKLHSKMKRLLKKKGTFVDVILFCPHHPKALVQKYKLDCEWRKPKSGMFKLVRNRFGIDLKKSFVVGDTRNDILWGKNAGVKSILVKTGQGGKDGSGDIKPYRIVGDICEAVRLILKRQK